MATTCHNSKDISLPAALQNASSPFLLPMNGIKCLGGPSYKIRNKQSKSLHSLWARNSFLLLLNGFAAPLARQQLQDSYNPVKYSGRIGALQRLWGLLIGQGHHWCDGHPMESTWPFSPKDLIWKMPMRAAEIRKQEATKKWTQT